MNLRPLPLPGAWVIEPSPHRDERGFFATYFEREEFQKAGLCGDFVQGAISWNRTRGTFRGMHYQVDPHPQNKLIRCTQGAIYDVLLDLRRGPTFGKWVSVELTAKNRLALYAPEGVAHGFQTLEDDTVVDYWISGGYFPECARGVRWNDPAFSIRLPLAVSVISPTDQSYPDFPIS